MYCPNCQRMVGIKKNLVPGIITIVLGFLIFFFIPFLGWLIGGVLCICGALALIFGGDRCPLCGSSNLTVPPPEKKEGNPQ